MKVDELKEADFGDQGWFSDDGMPWRRAKAQYLALIGRVAGLKQEVLKEQSQSVQLITQLADAQAKAEQADEQKSNWRLAFFAALAGCLLVYVLLAF